MDNATTGRTFIFESYPQRIAIATIVGLVVISGLIGNTMVILAVTLSRRLQTRTNIFVINLAIADLITCITAVFTVVALVSKDGWPLPDVVCVIAAAIGYLCVIGSILSLTAIAVNRYILITKPLHVFQAVYTPPRIVAMLAAIWIYSILVCSLPWTGLGKWGYSDKYKTCSQDTSHGSSDYFSLVGSLLVFPIPLCILFACYYKIYRRVTDHLKKMKKRSGTTTELTESSSGVSVGTSTVQLETADTSSGQVGLNKRQVQITKNLFTVMCAFVVCFMPFAVALVIPPSDPVIPWTGTIIIFNSAINPIIYGLKHPHFREVFGHMVRCKYHMIPEPSSILRRLRSQ